VVGKGCLGAGRTTRCAGRGPPAPPRRAEQIARTKAIVGDDPPGGGPEAGDGARDSVIGQKTPVPDRQPRSIGNGPLAHALRRLQRQPIGRSPRAETHRRSATPQIASASVRSFVGRKRATGAFPGSPLRSLANADKPAFRRWGAVAAPLCADLRRSEGICRSPSWSFPIRSSAHRAIAHPAPRRACHGVSRANARWRGCSAATARRYRTPPRGTRCRRGDHRRRQPAFSGAR
jgi:hypothetical protein